VGQIIDQLGYLFNIIFTYPIFNVLMVLYRLFGDFGLSIIVLTLIIRLVLFPLTLKQLKSMKATQALQPQMAEVRKKYKDQRAQAEAMQALYKEYGINPLGGCLPLVVQMPVLFGLFYALSTVLRNAKTVQDINKLLYPFIPPFHHFPNIDLNWFTFISPSLHFSLGAPDPTHILPILAALATFLQLRMSQPKNAAAANDSMSQQMKIMQLISPIMVLFFGWSYAAGLALYWTISSLFGMIQQYFVTGWGSLLVTPDFLSSKGNNNGKSNNNSKSYTGDRAKETKLLGKAEEPDNVVESGPVGRKLQTNSSGNSSSSARRRSASARRRSSNNIPKRNASRS